MSMNQYEAFYRGYTPASWYGPGYHHEVGYSSGARTEEYPVRQSAYTSAPRREEPWQTASSYAPRREEYSHTAYLTAPMRGEYMQAASSGAYRRNDYYDDYRRGIVELRMPLCCDGCVEKVHKKFKDMDGVSSIECNTELQKVTVRGTVKPEAVLKKAKKILSRSEFWKGRR